MRQPFIFYKKQRLTRFFLTHAHCSVTLELRGEEARFGRWLGSSGMRASSVPRLVLFILPSTLFEGSMKAVSTQTLLDDASTTAHAVMDASLAFYKTQRPGQIGHHNSEKAATIRTELHGFAVFLCRARCISSSAYRRFGPHHPIHRDGRSVRFGVPHSSPTFRTFLPAQGIDTPNHFVL